MGAPTITEAVGATFFYFNDIGVKVKVKQPVRQDKHGNMKSLITVIYEKMLDNQQILQGEINYTSLPIRKQVAKQLSEITFKTDATVPWSRILEIVCQEVTQKQNAGEPIDVIDSYNNEPPQYVIRPFIPLHQPTIIFGDGGQGKSTLALLMYFAATLPWHDNKLGWEIGKEAYKGLYLDWESDRTAMAYQRERLSNGLDIMLPPVNYLFCQSTLSDSIDYIQRSMDEVKADFIVVDSLAGACGGDLNLSEPATRFFNAIRMLNTTALIIAHNPKNAKEKSIYGAAIFEHRARSVWECKGVMEEGSDTLEMGLFHRKVNVGTRLKPMGLRFTYDDESIVIENISVKMIPEFKKSQSVQTQVYQALCDLPMTISELTDYLHPVKRNTVEVAIHRLLKDEAIVALADDKYAQSAAAKGRRR